MYKGPGSCTALYIGCRGHVHSIKRADAAGLKLEAQIFVILLTIIRVECIIVGNALSNRKKKKKKKKKTCAPWMMSQSDLTLFHIENVVPTKMLLTTLLQSSICLYRFLAVKDFVTSYTIYHIHKCYQTMIPYSYIREDIQVFPQCISSISFFCVEAM